MARLSELFLPTLREHPADADALSHRLMVRAGLIRQLGAGLWTYLPAGFRVIRTHTFETTPNVPSEPTMVPVRS